MPFYNVSNNSKILGLPKTNPSANNPFATN